MLDQRGQLLRAALGLAALNLPSYDRSLHALRSWLDSWAGIGHVAVGMLLSQLQIEALAAETKSGKRREVPMRQAVYDLLAALKGDHKGRVWPAGDVRTAFENAVVEAKLDGLHFHDLRHSFASWFVMRGGSLQALQAILGHQDIKMTLRYAHLAPEHLRSEMTRTERGAQTVSQITQAITHDLAPREVVPAP